MNRRNTRRLSFLGGGVALATALTAAAIADSHETGPAFDPTSPAVVIDVLEPTTDISDFTARTGPARLVLQQCFDGPETCVTAVYPEPSLDPQPGQEFTVGEIVTADPANQ
jgi:hypothetical protein